MSEVESPANVDRPDLPDYQIKTPGEIYSENVIVRIANTKLYHPEWTMEQILADIRLVWGTREEFIQRWLGPIDQNYLVEKVFDPDTASVIDCDRMQRNRGLFDYQKTLLRRLAKKGEISQEECKLRIEKLREVYRDHI